LNNSGFELPLPPLFVRLALLAGLQTRLSACFTPLHVLGKFVAEGSDRSFHHLAVFSVMQTFKYSVALLGLCALGAATAASAAGPNIIVISTCNGLANTNFGPSNSSRCAALQKLAISRPVDMSNSTKICATTDHGVAQLDISADSANLNFSINQPGDYCDMTWKTITIPSTIAHDLYKCTCAGSAPDWKLAATATDFICSALTESARR
jgi:hypothetical protein